MKPTTRKIRVFLSSTFRDMNDERNYLVRYVFPRVQEYCRKRFLEFYPVDLRWGITEEQSRSGLVLNACLSEIDDSRPFFVGILGSRYGWIPSIDEIGSFSPSLARESDWIVDEVVKGVSITEMEIEYAVLRDMNIPYASFFFRDENIEIPDDYKEVLHSTNANKLEKLKNRILSQSKYPVYTFTSLQEMGDRLYEQLIAMIETEYPASVNDGAMAIIAPHVQSLARRTKVLCSMPDVIENFDKWVQSKKKILVVAGDPGSGSSMALAVGVADLREKYQGKIIYFDFDSLPPNSSPIEQFKQFIALEENRVDPDEWSVIALDNLTTLSIPEINELADWIDDLSINTHIAMSVAESSTPCDIILFRFRCPSIRVHGLNEDMARDFVNNYTLQYGKRFTEEQIQKIVSSKASNSLTNLKLLLDAIISWDSYETLDKYIDDSIKSANCGNLFWNIVNGMVKSYSQAGLGSAFARALIAVSMLPEGISESDLIASTGLSKGAWSAVKPGVLRFCKGNDDRMMLIYSKWRHDVREIFDTHIRAQIGKQMTRWFVEDTERMEDSCRTLASIYEDIWHLPFTFQDSKENEEREVREYKDDVAKFAFTYRNVMAMSPGMLYRVLTDYIRDGSVVERVTREAQLTIDKISITAACDYVYTVCRTISAFQYQQNSVIASHCYRRLADILKSRNHPFEYPYRALSYLALGQCNKALEILQGSGLLPATGLKSIFKRQTKFEGEMFRAHVLALSVQARAHVLSGQFDKMQASCMSLAKIDIDDFKDVVDDAPIVKFMVSTLCEAFAILLMGGTQELCHMIVRMLNDIDDDVVALGLGSEACYYYMMARSIVNLRTGRMNELKSSSYYTLKCAERVFGVNNHNILLMFNTYSLQYNRAANLYAIAEYKLFNRYMNWENRPYKKEGYEMPDSVRKFTGVELKDVDKRVREFIYYEADFFTNAVNTIEPASTKAELNAALAKLKADLSL